MLLYFPTYNIFVAHFYINVYYAYHARDETLVIQKAAQRTCPHKIYILTKCLLALFVGHVFETGLNV